MPAMRGTALQLVCDGAPTHLGGQQSHSLARLGQRSVSSEEHEPAKLAGGELSTAGESKEQLAHMDFFREIFLTR